jgi:hypothetical protein
VIDLPEVDARDRWTQIDRIDVEDRGAFVVQTESHTVYLLELRDDGHRLIRAPEVEEIWIHAASGDRHQITHRWLPVTDLDPIETGKGCRFTVHVGVPGETPTLTSTPVAVIFRKNDGLFDTHQEPAR